MLIRKSIVHIASEVKKGEMAYENICTPSHFAMAQHYYP